MYQVASTAETRPEFMATLGLLPPYSLEDVRQAYKLKVRQTHPDAGGSADEFKNLQDAYEHAVEYVEFRGSRRGWLAAHVERYAREQELIAEVEELGGTVEIETEHWRTQSFGDFAQIAEHVVGLRLNGPQFTSERVLGLVNRAPVQNSLRLLDLAASGIDDSTLGHLQSCGGLVRLDLRDTSVTIRGLYKLAALKHLEQVHIGGTRVRWWQRWRLGFRLRHVKIVTSPRTQLSSAPRTRFSSVAEMATAR